MGRIIDLYRVSTQESGKRTAILGASEERLEASRNIGIHRCEGWHGNDYLKERIMDLLEQADR